MRKVAYNVIKSFQIFTTENQKNIYMERQYPCGLNNEGWELGSCCGAVEECGITLACGESTVFNALCHISPISIYTRSHASIFPYCCPSAQHMHLSYLPCSLSNPTARTNVGLSQACLYQAVVQWQRY